MEQTGAHGTTQIKLDQIGQMGHKNQREVNDTKRNQIKANRREEDKHNQIEQLGQI